MSRKRKGRRYRVYKNPRAKPLPEPKNLSCPIYFVQPLSDGMISIWFGSKVSHCRIDNVIAKTDCIVDHIETIIADIVVRCNDGWTTTEKKRAPYFRSQSNRRKSSRLRLSRREDDNDDFYAQTRCFTSRDNKPQRNFGNVVKRREERVA